MARRLTSTKFLSLPGSWQQTTPRSLGLDTTQLLTTPTISELSVEDPQRPSLQNQKTLKRVNITPNGFSALQAMMKSVPAVNELLV